MPLIIIAIIFLIGLLIYVIVGYTTSEHDEPLVKDRFPDKFKRKNSSQNFTVEEANESKASSSNADYPDQPEHASAEEKKNVYFPTDNIDLEKHKRNIH